MLLIAGDQVPTIPLFDVVGNVNVPPLQIEGICMKTGVITGFTTTVMVVSFAH